MVRILTPQDSTRPHKQSSSVQGSQLPVSYCRLYPWARDLWQQLCLVCRRGLLAFIDQTLQRSQIYLCPIGGK
ncbi:hypothetical protein FGO68_gene17350 [Halteria grandinella]|uniref:Uncharacterized protein n=1 Tax=Halteria grandinella TaxID=5974 RepID=A0A8J8NEC2_HALGN|nr:hypothetical protein FGO68_gene17350 [Halteria grandinella]